VQVIDNAARVGKGAWKITLSQLCIHAVRFFGLAPFNLGHRSGSQAIHNMIDCVL
jgi:hypothetical protein